jgi:hypothetical protein
LGAVPIPIDNAAPGVEGRSDGRGVILQIVW